MKIASFILFSFLSIHLMNAQFVYEEFQNCNASNAVSLVTTVGTYGFQVEPTDIIPFREGNCAIVYKQTDRSNTNTRTFRFELPEFKYRENLYLSFKVKYIKKATNAFFIRINRNLIYFVPESKEFSQHICYIPNTPYNNATITFEYSVTGNDYGAEIVVDDILINTIHNTCGTAIPIEVDQPCQMSTVPPDAVTVSPHVCNANALGSIYYLYKANFTGKVKLELNANYNDVTSIYTGDCNGLLPYKCSGFDEHGFRGEIESFDVVQGTNYFIKISKSKEQFGSDQGYHCIQLKTISVAPAPPLNDVCSKKINLTINSTCTTGSNEYADSDGPSPTLNQRSRSTVWYSFTPQSAKDLKIISNSNFAEVLTLYQGNCNALQELKVEYSGNNMILSAPKIGQEYILQVSGYFATIEGSLCVQVQEVNVNPSSNEDCPTAQAIALNSQCTSYNFSNASKSSKRPSCQVLASPDLWFSFVAPQERSITLDIQAGFMYNYTLYYGTCNALVEYLCQTSPDPCQGPIKINDLTAGRTYYLQITANYDLIQNSQGNVCVRIDESSKASPYSPINLNVDLECVHGVLGKLNYSSTGGYGKHSYHGPNDQAILLPGSKFDVFVEDEKKCRDFQKVEVNCTSPKKCNNSNLDISLAMECVKDNIGRNTGQVIINYSGVGGSGAYYFYGTPKGTQLNHGDDYKIIIIDTDSCFVIEEGRVNCPAFDCKQSNLKVDVQVNCVDSLLKASLTPIVTGNLGSYQVQQAPVTQFLDQGTTYVVAVQDDAGCTAQIEGKINCNFDSCVYSKGALKVSFTCLKNSDGSNTGKGVLNVTGSSKAGGLVYPKNKNGDVLDHLEKYDVVQRDAFNCELIEQGTVLCVPLSSDDQNSTSQNFIVYPNPTSGELTIMSNQFGQEEVNVEIFDMQGKRWLSQSVIPQNLVVNISAQHLVKGIYRVYCHNGTLLQHQMIIKE